MRAKNSGGATGGGVALEQARPTVSLVALAEWEGQVNQMKFDIFCIRLANLDSDENQKLKINVQTRENESQ